MVRTCGGIKTAFHPQAAVILVRIADARYLTTTELVEIMGMKRSNVSGYLARHREEGFIKTRADRKDKRIKYHSLTSKGREYLDNYRFSKK